MIVPYIVLALEEDSGADASLYEDTAGDIKNYDNRKLVVHEDEDTNSNINNILEDIGIYKSEDKIDPNHFKI